MNSPGLLNSLIDRLILPGAVGFTRFGYEWRKRSWDEAEYSMSSRTVVITGATSGLGLAAAHTLARLGARVVLVGRNPDKAESARQDIVAACGNDNVTVQLADLGLMSQVRSLAALEEYLARSAKLDSS